MLEFISIPALMLLGYIAGRFHGHKKLRKLRHECVRHGYGEYSRWGNGEFSLDDESAYRLKTEGLANEVGRLRWVGDRLESELARFDREAVAAAAKAGEEN